MTKTSVVITVLNEGDTIGALLDSLLAQTKKPEQIIIVDGGSNDSTVEIIRHYQKHYNRIKLLVEKSSRAKGRNLGCEIAKSEIIAMTDAGCIADKNWLKNITSPFEKTKVDVVAGYYHMSGGTPVECAMMKFMGVMPNSYDVNFLPSTRSMAFKKDIWEKVGGFPERLTGAAEDTVFNFKLIKNDAKLSRMKNAIVEWGMPTTISNFQFKIYNYAKGDAKSKIWIFPKKGFASHNIHSLYILLRYLLFLSLAIITFHYHLSLLYCLIVALLYIFWAFRKINMEFRSWKVAVWGPVLQIVSDFAVMRGFIDGILGKWR